MLAEAERLWQQAEQAAAGEAELSARVRQGHLPVRLAFLRDWKNLREECRKQDGAWPLPESRKEVAAQFAAACEGVPGKNWTHVAQLSESGLTVEKFVAQFKEDPTP